MTDYLPEAGSFRDPSGAVYDVDGRILRTVNECAVSDYEFVRDLGLLDELAAVGWIVEAKEVDAAAVAFSNTRARYVLEHRRIPFISYPYEWSFSALKAAALLHLDLHLKVLEQDVTLSDASAYNIQFLGPRPVFIDTLSLRRYREGEFWIGHRQFCEQFLNPLLLRALVGIAHNAWYRGSLEGITTSDLARIVPLRRKLSWNIITQVLLQAALQKAAISKPNKDFGKAIGRRHLPRPAFSRLLKQLRGWIENLKPAELGKTVWADYEHTHTYTSDEEMAKRSFVAEFINQTKPRMVWDLGCNTGEYSVVALKAGVDHVIGFDTDQSVLETAFIRAQAQRFDFLPLFVDAANPSPSQGWNQNERKGLCERAQADAIIALAFEHHLAIGRNIPLDRLVDWLVGLAPGDIIEFVTKDDPTVQKMLQLREDIFSIYTTETFVAALNRRARIVKTLNVSNTGRQLFWYDVN